jgi:hypothetical protein
MPTLPQRLGEAYRRPSPRRYSRRRLYVLRLRVQSRTAEQRGHVASHVMSTAICLTFVSINAARQRCPVADARTALNRTRPQLPISSRDIASPRSVDRE